MRANLRVNRRDHKQAKGLIGLVQKDMARDRLLNLQIGTTPRNPAKSRHLTRRKTDSRNGVTIGTALLGGRNEKVGVQAGSRRWKDCLKSKGLWES